MPSATTLPPPPLRWWQHAWRLVVVWLLGLVMWMVVGTIGTDGWTREGDEGALMLVLLVADLVLGQVAVGLALLRRRWPLAIALAIGALCLVSSFAVPASLLALLSLATRRHLPTMALALGVSLVIDTIYEFTISPLVGLRGETPANPLDEGTVVDGPLGLAINLAFVLLVYTVVVLVGWNIGARRELVESWRTQAQTARAEQAARVSQAQLAERARIAREMHDVLAHRLSLVAMHAGALAHRSDLPEAERKQAAEVVRAGAHQALEELREVLGVLRADEGHAPEGDRDPSAVDRDDLAGGGDLAHGADRSGLADGAGVEAPQPGLSGIPALVAEVSSSGQEVTLTADPQLWPRSVELPTSTGRHAYRIVQEALTNARKHAPGEQVAVWLDGRRGDGLTVAVTNRVAGVAADLPSGGRGLTGMAERVQLAGGRFSAQVEGEDFVVRAWMPWSKGGKK